MQRAVRPVLARGTHDEARRSSLAKMAWDEIQESWCMALKVRFQEVNGVMGGGPRVFCACGFLMVLGIQYSR